MKKALLLASALLVLALPAQASANLTALDPSAPGSPLTAAQAIVNDPLTLSGSSLPERAYGGTGAPSPLGVGDKSVQSTPQSPTTLADFPTFGNQYAILSSGQINDVASIFDQNGIRSFAFTNQIDDPDIERGPAAEDWTVWQIDVNVPSNASCIALDYRFMSEEYPSFVGEEYNDAFLAEIDDTTWSVDEDGAISRPNDFAVSADGKPISVNGVGDTAMFPTEAEGTYFNAATGLITTKHAITSGAHSIYLSIFDASDEIYDSAIFLDNLRFTAESAATCKPPEGKQLELPPPTPPTVTPPPPPPSNQFDIGSSIKFKAGTQATLTVNAPGPGTVTAGSVAVGAASASLERAQAVAAAKAKAKGKGKGKSPKKKAKKKKKALLIGSSVHVDAAGPVNVTVKLSSTGKAILKKKGKLTVPVTITFTPDGGTAASQVKKLTFKQPVKKCKSAKGKKGKAKPSAKRCGKAKPKQK